MTWIGDHGPRHVHVYRGSRYLGKWDLDKEKRLEGKIDGRAIRILHELRQEGRL